MKKFTDWLRKFRRNFIALFRGIYAFCLTAREMPHYCERDLAKWVWQYPGMKLYHARNHNCARKSCVAGNKRCACGLFFNGVMIQQFKNNTIEHGKRD